MFGWMRKRSNTISGQDRVPTDTSPGGVYSDLRQKAISTRRSEFTIPEQLAGSSVWGVLMETDYSGATATLLALIDGTTSLYLSNGGGVIGGQSQEKVMQANAKFIESANQ